MEGAGLRHSDTVAHFHLSEATGASACAAKQCCNVQDGNFAEFPVCCVVWLRCGKPLGRPNQFVLLPSFPLPHAGGFAAFSSCFPGLCEGKPATNLPMSLSQPCLPVANVGPTRILPHLYLGSQKDVLNKVRLAAQLGALPSQHSSLALNIPCLL